MATALVDIGNKMETLDQENGFQLISPPKKQAPPMDVVDASVTEEEGKADGDHITESMIRAQEQAKDEAAKVLEKEEAAPAEVHAPTLLQADPEVDQAHAPATAAGRKSQLDFLLQKAEAFSGFINGCQAEVQDRLSAQCQEEAAKEEEQAAASPAAAGGRKRKKGQRASPRQRAKQKQEAAEAAEGAMAEADAKMAAAKGEAEGRPAFRQPRRMTGGTLKGYQLEGLRWLASLYENGLSGILADEMGLGKTIQVIAFLAYLTEMGVSGPFLVAAPLATLPNWVLEFQKWVPDLPVALYHGSKEERAQLRRRRLRPADQRKPQFPIVITSYEICIIDRPYLQNYNFKFMVIDEGQRIKNRNCRLVRELKQIPSESRLLLSGTPIQNTLEELWTLLNFVNPAIFDDLTVFQGWFGFRNIGKETQVDDILDGEARGRIVTKLHEILRPFLLRRLKKDVLTRMPPKREVVVYAPMTQLQLDYTALIHQGGLRDALLQMGIEGAAALTEINKTMNLRKAANHPFLFGEPRTDGGEYVGEAHPELMAAASGKLALFDRMLADLRRGGHKTLVFSQMTSVLARRPGERGWEEEKRETASATGGAEKEEHRESWQRVGGRRRGAVFLPPRLIERLLESTGPSTPGHSPPPGHPPLGDVGFPGGLLLAPPLRLGWTAAPSASDHGSDAGLVRLDQGGIECNAFEFMEFQVHLMNRSDHPIQSINLSVSFKDKDGSIISSASDPASVMASSVMFCGILEIQIPQIEPGASRTHTLRVAFRETGEFSALLACMASGGGDDGSGGGARSERAAGGSGPVDAAWDDAAATPAPAPPTTASGDDAGGGGRGGGGEEETSAAASWGAGAGAAGTISAAAPPGGATEAPRRVAFTTVPIRVAG